MIIKSIFDKLVDAISLRCALVFDSEKQYLVCEACPINIVRLFHRFGYIATHGSFSCVFFSVQNQYCNSKWGGALTDLHLQVKRINYSKRRFEVKATSVAIVLTEECSPLPDASFLR